MKKRIFFVGIAVLGVLFCGCNSCNRKEVQKPIVNKSEVKEIQKSLDVHIWRYEQALNAIDRDSISLELSRLQKDYYFLKGENFASPVNVSRINNYLNDKKIEQLYDDVQRQFPDLVSMEKEFTDAFSLLKYHFPKSIIPRIYTVIQGLYYEMPIEYRDTFLIISLDMYLGKDYKAYKQLGPEVPKFISRRYSKEFIMPDCFKEISYQYIKQEKAENSLLDAMIYEGKRLLFAESMLPNMPDSLIFPFPQKTILWAKNNEASIWGYLIENNYLYSKDNAIIRKFIAESPFTNFFGQQSPGRVGAWIGWQICRSWMQKNPDKKLSDLMNETDAQKILTKSKYKPKK